MRGSTYCVYSHTIENDPRENMTEENTQKLKYQVKEQRAKT